MRKRDSDSVSDADDEERYLELEAADPLICLVCGVIEVAPRRMKVQLLFKASGEGCLSQFFRIFARFSNYPKLCIFVRFFNAFFLVYHFFCALFVISPISRIFAHF